MGTGSLDITRAYLFITDSEESLISVTQEDAIKLEYLNYKCSRRRNELGIPYGTTQQTILRFAAICKSEKLDTIYERLKDTLSYTFTFIFNPVFSEETHKIESLNRGFITTGYIISVNEIAGFFKNLQEKISLEDESDSAEGSEGEKDESTKENYAESVTVSAKLLLNSIKFIYSEKDLPSNGKDQNNTVITVVSSNETLFINN